MSIDPFSRDAPASLDRTGVERRPDARAARRLARRGLRPIEADLLVRYGEWCSQTVLELGSRADGLTAALVHRAERFIGLCEGTAELGLCRRRFPAAEFLLLGESDFEDLMLVEFDAIVAGRCGLDGLGHGGRLGRLAAVADLLARDGLLLFSSHNLEREAFVPSPVAQLRRRPWLIGRLRRARANRRRLGPLQERGHGYGVLNLPGRSFGSLVYHVSRDGQERQLADCDLVLRECLDRSGRLVPAWRHAPAETELHYVAARVA